MNRMLVLISGLLTLSLVWAGGATAQGPKPVQRALSGQVQGYIGSGLPIPIRAKGTPMDASCLPQGAINGVQAVAGAKITTYANGGIFLQPSQFTVRGPGNPYGGKVQGVMTQNPVALQVYTNFAIQAPAPGGNPNPIYPHSGGTIPAKIAKAGGMSGRTGPNTVTWCPGRTATVIAGNNPACPGPPSAGDSISIYTCGSVTPPLGQGCPGPNKALKKIPGIMRYTRTGNMLGGPGSSALQGKFDVAIGAPGGGAFFIKGYPPANAVAGNSFGNYFQMNAGKGPQAAPVYFNNCGVINFIGPVIATKAAENRTTGSFGGPITQGELYVYADTGLKYERYFLKGSDTRKVTPLGRKGAGKLSLVAGSLGLRSLTGENANRSFLFLEVPEPGAVAGAVAALGILVACHQMVRRRSR